MTISRRLDRLEQMNAQRPTQRDTLSIHDELSRDDPDRLAQIFAAMARAGLLDDPPDPDDDSQLAQLIRAAEAAGLIHLIKARSIDSHPTCDRV